MLDNITVTYTELVNKKYDIVSRYDADHDIFNNAITEAKRELYSALKMRLRKDYPDYTNSELDTVAGNIIDLENEQYLKTRLAYLSIAIIYEQNEMLAEASYYRQLAEQTPLIYGIDGDSDDTVDDEEVVSHAAVSMGR